MSEITDIRSQKKANRASIYVDGKYSVGLTLNQILDEKLKVGLQIDESRIELLKALSGEALLHDRTLNWLVMRPRSEREVFTYLTKHCDDGELREKIVDRLKDRGYIDDYKFAESWLNDRRTLKLYSDLKLRMELRQKGVASGIIDMVMESDESDEVQVIRDIIEKKSKISRYQDSQKLMSYLARQGFSYDKIKQAMED